MCLRVCVCLCVYLGGLQNCIKVQKDMLGDDGVTRGRDQQHVGDAQQRQQDQRRLHSLPAMRVSMVTKRCSGLRAEKTMGVFHADYAASKGMDWNVSLTLSIGPRVKILTQVSIK